MRHDARSITSWTYCLKRSDPRPPCMHLLKPRPTASAQNGDVPLIAQALGILGRAMDQLLADSTDPDAFISAVFQCRDCIMALDLMVRAQAGR